MTTMNAFLAVFSEISTLVFAVSSMLTVGLSYTIAQILAPLRDGRAVLRTLLGNFVLVPLMAFLVIRMFALEAEVAIGLMLLATAAGSPFLLKLTKLAEGDVGIAAGLLVMLLIATMAYMPIVVPLVAPGATVKAMAIALPLVLSMLLPLVTGLLVDTWLPRLAERLRPLTSALSSVSIVLLIASLLVLHLGAILTQLKTETMVAAVIFPLAAFGFGLAMARRGVVAPEILSFATAQRNVAAALVVATQSFEEPLIALMIIFVSLVTLVLLFPIAWMMRQRRPPSGTAAAGRGPHDRP